MAHDLDPAPPSRSLRLSTSPSTPPVSAEPAARPVPITYVVVVYNEQERIEAVLAHAVHWADEVIILDKHSTDRTAAIAAAFHPKVRVIPIPFSPQGQDRSSVEVNFSSNDWIFGGTCSEIPTRRLIAEARKLVDEQGDRLEMIYVPKKMYSLGIHEPNSPWNIHSHGLLFHRRRVIYTEVIHEHFKPRNPANTAAIPYAPDCCVYHLTHLSAARFVEVHAAYAQVESTVDRDPQLAMLECFRRINERAPSIFRTGGNWPGIFSAWCIYNLLNVLFIWEKARGLDTKASYAQLRTDLLRQEWGVTLPNACATSAPEPPPPTGLGLEEKKIQDQLGKTVFLAYVVANTAYHLQNPRAIPGSLRAWTSFQIRRAGSRLKKILRSLAGRRNRAA